MNLTSSFPSAAPIPSATSSRKTACPHRPSPRVASAKRSPWRPMTPWKGASGTAASNLLSTATPSVALQMPRRQTVLARSANPHKEDALFLEDAKRFQVQESLPTLLSGRFVSLACHSAERHCSFTGQFRLVVGKPNIRARLQAHILGGFQG